MSYHPLSALPPAVIKINWASVQDAVPAFLTMAIMPLTYSISYGFIAGIISWMFINLCILLWNLVHVYAFPKTFPAEAMEAGGGNPFKAAWWLTGNPPRQKGLVVDIPDDSDTALRAMTFRMHTTEAEAEAPAAPAKGDVETPPTTA